VDLAGWSKFAFAVLTEQIRRVDSLVRVRPLDLRAGNGRKAAAASTMVGVEYAATFGVDAVCRRLTEPHW
jgi:hypothetical protein